MQERGTIRRTRQGCCYTRINAYTPHVRSLTIGISAELKHAAIGDLQFLEEPAIRAISGRQCRCCNLVTRLQATPVRSAHPGPAESPGASQLESPLLHLPLGVLDIHRQVRM